ncbi:MAG: hypothetical protein IPM22_05660 [Betaproteobacteria bacterium]|nr:hypothetical protein [Betaproteobacteria bacterium]MCC7216261.1 hypothetical protein [Burkholderiales bacterium]
MHTSFDGEIFPGGEHAVAHARRRPDRDLHALPDAVAPRRAREIGRRVRALEDAWALHANAANGFGAGETVAWPQDA